MAATGESAFLGRAADLLGSLVTDIEPLGGGCVSEVYLLRLADGRQVVAKVDDQRLASLPIEAKMLDFLHRETALPVPRVLHHDERLLLLDHIAGESRFSAAAEVDAAERLVALHSHAGPAFGFDYATLIGGLKQPNPWEPSWLDFFARDRLRHMAGEAAAAGRLSARVLERVERLADNLGHWLSEPDRPSLIHGDVWTTNVLARQDRIVAFLDPAIYYADPEIELAFITLFGTFGPTFFSRYGALRPIRAGFFEERRHLYNLYPLLVHVRLFGGSYVAAVEQTLVRFGY